MAKNKLWMLALAALLLAVMTAFFLAARYGARPGVKPVLPAAPAAAVTEIQSAKKQRAPVNGARHKKNGARIKTEEKRAKRVSALRDPGEALISGVGRDTAASSGAPARNK